MKRYITLILFFLSLCAQAQIVTAWTADLPSNKIPSGATIPTLTELDDPTVIRFQLAIDASSVDNANKATAFAALGAAVKTAIDSNWVQDVWDIKVTDDITMNIIIKNVQRGWTLFELGDPINFYLADEDVFNVWGRVEYVKD